MTNEKATEMFKDIMMAEIDRLPHHYDAEVDGDVYDDMSKANEILQLNKIVSKALKKADKYRWHDLRKNPDDLPEPNEYNESGYVAVMIDRRPHWWDDWDQDYYNHEKKEWAKYEQNVRAWRYIEPFEEEEKND